MKLLLQIGTIFGIYWVSECISAVLPFPFPASVISLLVLLALLLSGVLKLERINDVAGFLLGNLAFFFVPVASSIMKYFSMIWENFGAFLTICIVSMVVTYGATVGAVRLTCRLMKKEDEK